MSSSDAFLVTAMLAAYGAAAASIAIVWKGCCYFLLRVFGFVSGSKFLNTDKCATGYISFFFPRFSVLVAFGPPIGSTSHSCRFSSLPSNFDWNIPDLGWGGVEYLIQRFCSKLRLVLSVLASSVRY